MSVCWHWEQFVFLEVTRYLHIGFGFLKFVRIEMIVCGVGIGLGSYCYALRYEPMTLLYVNDGSFPAPTFKSHAQAPPASTNGSVEEENAGGAERNSTLVFEEYYGDHNGFFGLAFGLVALLGPFGYEIPHCCSNFSVTLS